MVSKKQDNDSDDVVVEMDLDSIFNWDKEEKCFENQFAGNEGNEDRIAYKRQIPLEQKRWNDFKAKCIDVNSGKWYTSGENTGIPKGKEGPKRIVQSIVRIKAKNASEYILTTGRIKAFNQFGDPVFMPYTTPEKYIETTFRWETRPNREIGYAQRVNVGPSGSALIYTLPFSKEAAQKLYYLRESDNIDLLVKIQDQSSTYAVKKQNASLEDNFKMFTEESFNYLYYANYLTNEEKIINMRKAEMQGIIPTQTEDERAASIAAQTALSQKDKMASYR